MRHQDMQSMQSQRSQRSTIYQIKSEDLGKKLPDLNYIKLKQKRRMYTKDQYKRFQIKLKSVQKQYAGIVKNFKIGKTGDQFKQGYQKSNQNIKQMILLTEPILQQTYSYKYFGVNNGQFGILSKRQPFLQESELRSRSTQKYRTITNDVSYKLKSTSRNSKQRHSSVIQSRKNLEIVTDNKKVVTSYFLGKKLTRMPKIVHKSLDINGFTDKKMHYKPKKQKINLQIRSMKKVNKIEANKKRFQQQKIQKLQRVTYRNYGFSLTYLKHKKTQEKMKKIKEVIKQHVNIDKQGKIKYQTSYSALLRKLTNFLDNKINGLHEFMLHKDIQNFLEDNTKVPNNQLYKYFLKILTNTDDSNSPKKVQYSKLPKQRTYSHKPRKKINKIQKYTNVLDLNTIEQKNKGVSQLESAIDNMEELNIKPVLVQS